MYNEQVLNKIWAFESVLVQVKWYTAQTINLQSFKSYKSDLKNIKPFEFESNLKCQFSCEKQNEL